MGSTFWTNTIWYILLGVTTIFEIIFTLMKAKDRKTVLALFFTIAGMTFAFELIIFCFLKSYNYYPMIIPQSSFDDGFAGNLFSQFSITATALLIAVLNMRNYWFFIFAGVYGVIEELFLNLGVYEHYWYRTWMTVVGLVLLFGIVKRMYQNSLEYIGRIWRYIYILFGLYALHMPTIIWTFKLLGIQTFSQKILSDEISSYFLLAILNLFFLSNVIMIIHLLKLDNRWKAVVILTLYIAHYIAYRLHLVLIKEGWFFIFTTVNIFGMYLYVYILDKLYDQYERS